MKNAMSVRLKPTATSVRLKPTDMIPLYSLQGLIQADSGTPVTLGDTIYIASLTLNMLLRSEEDLLLRETITTMSSSPLHGDPVRWRQSTTVVRELVDEIIKGRNRRKGER